MKSYSSISIKFTSWYLALLGILLLALGFGTYFSMSKRMHDTLDTTLLERAEQIKQFKNVLYIIAGGTFEGEPGERLSFYYYVDNRLEHISYNGQEVQIDPELIDQVLKTGAGRYFIQTGEEEQQLRFYLSPYSALEHPEINLRPAQPQPPRDANYEMTSYHGRKMDIPAIESAVLVIARPTKPIELALNQLAQILVVFLPLTLLLMGCCGIFFLRIVLRPVQNITDTTQDIEASDLSRRIRVTTKDELGRLGATINHMIARLEKAFVRQKELTGDASHELRAPLAVIQAEATLALQKERDPKSYQKSLEVIVSETGHMTTLIGQLLFLARVDSGNESVNFEIIDLAPFLEDLCMVIEPLCAEKKQSLDMDRVEPAEIKGDSNLLRRVVINLLHNAIQYTPEEGKISLSLVKAEGEALLSVTDNGIGIHEEELSHIFKRFFRVDKARSRESGSSGLGLAICKQIIDLHQGKIEVSSQPSRGTSFVVRLPLAG